MPEGTVAFGVGSGRCGTTLLSRLAAREPAVAASHERLRRAATFHMFCKWHRIPIDPEGFLRDRDAVVREDLAAHRVSFEVSALLSHSIAELYERYDARFVMLVRRPDHTVASFAARGWFLEPIPWADATRPPTLPDAMEPRHFFGRNLPRTQAELDRWRALSQIGKLAWFWDARYRAIVEQLARLPEDRARIQRIEDLDHAAYGGLARFLGWEPTLASAAFEELVHARVHTGPNPPRRPETWTSLEIEEHERETGRLASALGYEPRIGELARGAPVTRRPSPDPRAVLAALEEPA